MRFQSGGITASELGRRHQSPPTSLLDFHPKARDPHSDDFRVKSYSSGVSNLILPQDPHIHPADLPMVSPFPKDQRRKRIRKNTCGERTVHSWYWRRLFMYSSIQTWSHSWSDSTSPLWAPERWWFAERRVTDKRPDWQQVMEGWTGFGHGLHCTQIPLVRRPETNNSSGPGTPTCNLGRAYTHRWAQTGCSPHLWFW